MSIGHVDFWSGFLAGGLAVGFAAMQFIRGYREGIKDCAVELLKDGILKAIRREVKP